MTRDTADARWKTLRGRIKQTWSELSDADLDRFEGQRDRFVGHIQERFGWSRVDVERRLDEIDRAEGALSNWGGTTIH